MDSHFIPKDEALNRNAGSRPFMPTNYAFLTDGGFYLRRYGSNEFIAPTDGKGLPCPASRQGDGQFNTPTAFGSTTAGRAPPSSSPTREQAIARSHAKAKHPQDHRGLHPSREHDSLNDVLLVPDWRAHHMLDKNARSSRIWARPDGRASA